MWSGFQRDESGGIAIIAALMLPVLIGAAALAVETGYWFMIQRQAQHAADMAAYSGAVRLARSDSETSSREGAVSVAHGNGLPRSTGEVTVNFPDEFHVEVIVSDTRERLFTRIFLDQDIVLTARAVARISRDDEERGVPVCMLSLSPNADGAVSLNGAARVTLENCAVEARSESPSALSSGGSSLLTSACVNLRGGAEGNAPVITECEDIRTGTAIRDIPQQLLDMPSLSNPGSVPAFGSGTVRNQTLTPQDVGHPSGLPMMRFQGGVTFQGNVTMQPGVYIFDGGQFSTQGNTTINATGGVVIYLMNGARLNFGNNTTANMQAMQSGPWEDVLVFDSQDAASRQTHVLVGSRMTGVIYTPNAKMDFGGGTGVDDGCFMFIADRLEFTGSANVTSSCELSAFDLDAFYSGGGAPGAIVVELVE